MLTLPLTMAHDCTIAGTVYAVFSGITFARLGVVLLIFFQVCCIVLVGCVSYLLVLCHLAFVCMSPCFGLAFRCPWERHGTEEASAALEPQEVR